MLIIAANDLKKIGIAIIKDSLQENDEVIITVRDKPRFVVVTMERHDNLHQYELKVKHNSTIHNKD